MKRIVFLLRCFESQIKKLFFKGKNHEKNKACDELRKMNEDLLPREDLQHMEEYTDFYKMTTRWQTI